MTDLLSDNPDVMNSLLAALCDPGRFTPRAPLETLESWQRRAVIEHAAPYIQAAGRDRAEAAEVKLAEYENAISWHTSCTSCAKVLDSAYAETIRREQAEAKLATLAAHNREHLNLPGSCCPHLARENLAIIGTEEEADRG